jgi:hypothetical protein
MIELVRHIEILLLENDCVIVPGVGGFITYDMPASWDVEENIFSPPVRTIGFNPRLKINDGILVQSYMEAYHTDFADAAKILEQAVNKLAEVLHKEGKVEMANIGEISLSIHGTYVFSPYDDKIISPFLYGLDSFEIKELKGLLRLSTGRVLNPQRPAHKRMYEIRINRALVRNAVAAAAAILLFFYMSTPIGNTYVEKENYAQLLPADLFSKIGRQSLLTTPVGADVVTEPVISQPEPEADPQPASTLYHIIVASVVFNDDAQAMAAGLKTKGYHDACVLAGEDRTRVSIGTYSTREEANKRLVELRKESQYKNAWLFIQ